MKSLKYLTFFPFLVLLLDSYADNPSLAVSLIPEELKENSYAVIRKEIMVFEIHDESSATLEHKKTVTILDPRYKDLSGIYLFYIPQSTVKSISGKKYDAEGKEIDKLRNKDIEDYSAFSGSFYDENRIKVFDLLFLDQGFLKEDMMDISWLRWLYTGMTRATEELYLVNFNKDFFV